MSYWKIINIDKVVTYYNMDNSQGIDILLKGYDTIIYEDDLSSKIVKNWKKGNKEKSIQLINNYVSRIIT